MFNDNISISCQSSKVCYAIFSIKKTTTNIQLIEHYKIFEIIISRKNVLLTRCNTYFISQD